MRDALPGLVCRIDTISLYAAIGAPKERSHLEMINGIDAALVCLQRPDADGKHRFLFDASQRLARIPDAPACFPVDGPMQLIGWYRTWSGFPDHDFKWQHLESVKSGIRSDSSTLLRQRWDETFGSILTGATQRVDLEKPARRGQVVARFRARVHERDNFRCVLCGAGPFWDRTVEYDGTYAIPGLACDHRIPVAHGGETTVENIQSLCDPCHARKTAAQLRLAKLNVEDAYTVQGNAERYAAWLAERGLACRG